MFIYQQFLFRHLRFDICNEQIKHIVYYYKWWLWQTNGRMVLILILPILLVAKVIVHNNNDRLTHSWWLHSVQFKRCNYRMADLNVLNSPWQMGYVTLYESNKNRLYMSKPLVKKTEHYYIMLNKMSRWFYYKFFQLILVTSLPIWEWVSHYVVLCD